MNKTRIKQIQIDSDINPTTPIFYKNMLDGVLDTDGVNKGQLDAAVEAAILGVPRVNAIEFSGNYTIAAINGLTPATGWSVVATDAGTPTAGTSDALAAGDVAEFDGTSWKKIVSNVGGFVADGTKLIISTITLVSPLTNGVDEDKIADFDGTTNTPILETPTDGARAIVKTPSVNKYKEYIFESGSPFGTWVTSSDVDLTVVEKQTKNASAVTTGDAQLSVTDIFGSDNPRADCVPKVVINASEIYVAKDDSERTTSDGYFTNDSGVTAVAFGSLAGTEDFYWNGVVAGYDLDASDTVVCDFTIEV
jgi:hypothetical protein